MEGKHVQVKDCRLLPSLKARHICTSEVYECQIETAHWVAIRIKGNETSLFWFHIHCCDFKELLRKSSIAEARVALGYNAKLQPIISGKSRQLVTSHHSQGGESKHILACFLLPCRSPFLLLYWNCCLRNGTAHNDLSFPTSIKYKDNPWQPYPWANLL